MENKIIIRGAKEKNLKNVSVRIPKNEITAVVGVSGSGKSALVFDTIAAESQRQLNETYNSFVRSRLPHYGKPTVEAIQNLAVSIIIDQRRLGGSRRSTVGTATDIYSLLRLLFSRIGTPFVGYSDVFSFNNPQGMCPSCQGLGVIQDFSIEQLLDKEKSLNEGAIRFPTFYPAGFRWKRYVDSGLFDNDKKIRNFSAEELDTLLYRSGFKPAQPKKQWPPTAIYEGIVPRIRKAFLNKESRDSSLYRKDIERIAVRKTCPDCQGSRLNAKVRTCKIADKNIADCTQMTILELISFLEHIHKTQVASVVEEILQQLYFMKEVGLDYLTLDRATATLSGGESQRIKMIKQLGSSLNDLIYIFDEPSIGLHPADIHRVNQLLFQLRDKGNTILLVEHDPDVIKIADQIIEVGPSSGKKGGEIVFQGKQKTFSQTATLTSAYLHKKNELKSNSRKICDWMELKDVSLFNIHHLDVKIPAGVLTVVTGVAGSGKSTLFNQIFPQYYPDCVIIDQKPIARSKRSNVATFIGIFDRIRQLFAKENKVESSNFSFNSKGACPNCKGLGVVDFDLAFMESVTDLCEVCGGRRFSSEVLQYLYQGKNISQVLEFSVEEALAYFDDAWISSKLEQLKKVGLGYMSLGQSLNTLSGGELQRLKLATQLKKSEIYIFDEPTTGLHFSDIEVLLQAFEELLVNGSTLIVIEHNLEMICNGDWVIDMGPGAGEKGGQILFAGSPGELLRCEASATARYLKNYLGR